MLHYVHQLVLNCVCLLFAAEQLECSGFLELFLWKALSVNQNSNVAAWQLNNELLLIIKQHKCWDEWQIQLLNLCRLITIEPIYIVF